jgi:hypothetical protein
MLNTQSRGFVDDSPRVAQFESWRRFGLWQQDRQVADSSSPPAAQGVARLPIPAGQAAQDAHRRGQARYGVVTVIAQGPVAGLARDSCGNRAPYLGFDMNWPQRSTAS